MNWRMMYALHITARLQTFLARQFRRQRQAIFELLNFVVVEVDLSLFGEAKKPRANKNFVLLKARVFFEMYSVICSVPRTLDCLS